MRRRGAGCGGKAMDAGSTGSSWARHGPVEPRMIRRVASRCCVDGDVGALDPREQAADGGLALEADRLVDRRQRRVRVLADVDVVEADDREVARDVERRARARPAGRRSPSRRTSRGPRSVAGRPPRRRAAPPSRPRSSTGRRPPRPRRARCRCSARARAVAAHPATADAGRFGGVPGVVSMPTMSRSRWPRPMRCWAAAYAPPSSSTSTVGRSGRALESTITSGRPAARSCSTSGWCADTPMATTPSTIARSTARVSDPCERRDELQGVALVLGRPRDALGEGPEERVREDHRRASAG